MVNPQYIEYLNTLGADIDTKSRSLKTAKPPEKRDTAQLEKHTAKELPPIKTAGLDDLPFKIKTGKWEWQEVK